MRLLLLGARRGLMILTMAIVFAPSQGGVVIAQTNIGIPSSSQWPFKGALVGEDAKKVEDLNLKIDALIANGQFGDAAGLVQKVLEVRLRVQGANHWETGDARRSLQVLQKLASLPAEGRAEWEKSSKMRSDAYAKAGERRFAEAIKLLSDVLEIRRRLIGDVNIFNASTRSNLAYFYLLSDRAAEAEPVLREGLEIDRRLVGEDHPWTALSYMSLTANLNTQGKYAESETMDRAALGIYRRLFGEDHPTTANAYHNVATDLHGQGRYAEAEPLFQKALETILRTEPGDVASVALIYGYIASNLSERGKHAEAETLLRRAIEIQVGARGEASRAAAKRYQGFAQNLHAQGRYDEAEPLYHKALEIRRRIKDVAPLDPIAIQANLANLQERRGRHSEAERIYVQILTESQKDLAESPPLLASIKSNLALVVQAQGRHAEAERLLREALEVQRRVLGEKDWNTIGSSHKLGVVLWARGKYREAAAELTTAARGFEAARLSAAFTGLDRASASTQADPLLSLAAVLARLDQPSEAWQRLEEDLGRGLLDELAARQDQRLAPEERARLRELTATLERLDRLVETTPQNLDKAERAKRFEDLKRQRELASIALGEFQTKVVQDYGPLAGQVAGLNEIQAALPADAALVAWVDIPPAGPNAADPDGEHWGVVVRSRGNPAWVPISGTGPDGLWTKDDTGLAGRARKELRRRPGAGTTDLQPLVENLRTQRLAPLAKALGSTPDGLPPARRLNVLPSRAMAGIPVEALLAPDDTRTASYAPSATVYKYLREQPRPDRHAGLLALGDPVYERLDKSSDPKPLPDHGLLVDVVMPGSNAATHGLKHGDVLLTYNGMALNKKDDLKVIAESDKSIVVDVWRDGRSFRRDLAPGKLGVVVDPRPAPEAIAENRKLQQVLVAARGGDEDFAPLPGTRYEVEALAQLFKSDGRPTRTLLAADASEPELDRLAASGELGRCGFIHLATHGVIDEGVPVRSAVILTQTGLPDPLEQVLNHKPVFDGRLSVREIQHGWVLKAELVTLSACETALGPDAGGEGFVGFTQALLMSGTRSVCLSLWKVDDTATALLMQRFYANLLGRRPGLNGPMPKAEALREAKAWLRGLRRAEALAVTAELSGGVARGKGEKARRPDELAPAIPAGPDNDRPYAPPYFWAAFVLAGDPD